MKSVVISVQQVDSPARKVKVHVYAIEDVNRTRGYLIDTVGKIAGAQIRVDFPGGSRVLTTTSGFPGPFVEVDENSTVTVSLVGEPAGWRFTNYWDIFGVSWTPGPSRTFNVGTTDKHVAAAFTRAGGYGALGVFDLDYRGTPPNSDGNDQPHVVVPPGANLTLFFRYNEGNAGNRYIVRVYPEWNKNSHIGNSDNNETMPEVGQEIGGYRWDMETYRVPTTPGIYKVRVVYSASATPPTWDRHDRLLAEGTVVVQQTAARKVKVHVYAIEDVNRTRGYLIDTVGKIAGAQIRVDFPGGSRVLTTTSGFPGPFVEVDENSTVTVSLVGEPAGWRFTNYWDIFGVSWTPGPSRTFNVGTTDKHVAAFLQKKTVPEAVSGIVEAFMEALSLTKDALKKEYEAGWKYFLVLSASIHDVVSIALLLDLADYLGITEEGEKGWITLVYELSASAGLCLSPADIGFLRVDRAASPCEDYSQDVQIEIDGLEVVLVGRVNVMEVLLNRQLSVQGATSNMGVRLFGVSVKFSVEVHRNVLNEALSLALSPGLYQAHAIARLLLDKLNPLINSRDGVRRVTCNDRGTHDPTVSHRYKEAGGCVVSVPCEGVTASTFGAMLLAWDGKGWRLINDNEFLSPVEGYYTELPVNKFVTVTCSPPRRDYSVGFARPGQYLISSPWPYPKDKIQVIRSGETRSWADAVAAKWISDLRLHRSGPSETVTTLNPWYGYWFTAHVEGIRLVFAYANRVR